MLAQRRETDDAPPVSDYAAMLVEGVVAHRDRIDQLLAEHAEGWTVARMPAVDRNLLRIGVFELLWVDEIDDPVAITEAVELARHALDRRLARASSTACSAASPTSPTTCAQAADAASALPRRGHGPGPIGPGPPVTARLADGPGLGRQHAPAR